MTLLHAVSHSKKPDTRRCSFYLNHKLQCYAQYIFYISTYCQHSCHVKIVNVKNAAKSLNQGNRGHFCLLHEYFFGLSNSSTAVSSMLWKCSHIPRTITNLPNLIPRDQTQRKRNGKTFAPLVLLCTITILGYLQGLHGSVAPKCLLIYFFALGCFYVSILGDR